MSAFGRVRKACEERQPEPQNETLFQRAPSHKNTTHNIGNFVRRLQGRKRTDGRLVSDLGVAW